MLRCLEMRLWPGAISVASINSYDKFVTPTLQKSVTSLSRFRPTRVSPADVTPIITFARTQIIC